MKAYFDTNVLLAALVKGQKNYRSSFGLLRMAAADDLQGFLSSHGLTELYSVLTRVPFPVPVSPAEAVRLIEQTIVPSLTIVDIRSNSYLAALSACGRDGWRGGRIHDAVHIEAARQAGCDLIYTYDVAHFKAMAPEWGDRIQNPPDA